MLRDKSNCWNENLRHSGTKLANFTSDWRSRRMSKRGGINNQNRRRETREDPPQKALSVQKAGEERIGAPVNGADRFQTLYEDAPFATVMIDREGRFQYLNSRFKQLFGCSPGDVPDGRTWFRKAFPDPEYRHTIVSTGAGIGIQGLPSEGGRRDRSPGSAGRTAAPALRNR